MFRVRVRLQLLLPMPGVCYGLWYHQYLPVLRSCGYVDLRLVRATYTRINAHEGVCDYFFRATRRCRGAVVAPESSRSSRSRRAADRPSCSAAVVVPPSPLCCPPRVRFDDVRLVVNPGGREHVLLRERRFFASQHDTLARIVAAAAPHQTSVAADPGDDGPTTSTTERVIFKFWQPCSWWFRRLCSDLETQSWLAPASARLLYFAATGRRDGVLVSGEPDFAALLDSDALYDAARLPRALVAHHGHLCAELRAFRRTARLLNHLARRLLAGKALLGGGGCGVARSPVDAAARLLLRMPLNRVAFLRNLYTEPIDSSLFASYLSTIFMHQKQQHGLNTKHAAATGARPSPPTIVASGSDNPVTGSAGIGGPDSSFRIAFDTADPAAPCCLAATAAVQGTAVGATVGPTPVVPSSPSAARSVTAGHHGRPATDDETARSVGTGAGDRAVRTDDGWCASRVVPSLPDDRPSATSTVVPPLPSPSPSPSFPIARVVELASSRPFDHKIYLDMCSSCDKKDIFELTLKLLVARHPFCQNRRRWSIDGSTTDQPAPADHGPTAHDQPAPADHGPTATTAATAAVLPCACALCATLRALANAWRYYDCGKFVWLRLEFNRRFYARVCGLISEHRVPLPSPENRDDRGGGTTAPLECEDDVCIVYSSYKNEFVDRDKYVANFVNYYAFYENKERPLCADDCSGTLREKISIIFVFALINWQLLSRVRSSKPSCNSISLNQQSLFKSLDNTLYAIFSENSINRMTKETRVRLVDVNAPFVNRGFGALPNCGVNAFSTSVSFAYEECCPRGGARRGDPVVDRSRGHLN